MLSQARVGIGVAVPGSVGDTTSTIVVLAVVLGLFVLGLALVTAAVWVIRSTRVEPAALTPLEEMGTRSWLGADEASRLLLLEQARAEVSSIPRTDLRIVEEDQLATVGNDELAHGVEQPDVPATD